MIEQIKQLLNETSAGEKSEREFYCAVLELFARNSVYERPTNPLSAAQAENKRLREALERVAVLDCSNPVTPYDAVCIASSALSTPADTAEIDRLVADAGLIHTFINAAAGEGLVLDGVDAGELYVKLYPERYAEAIKGLSESIHGASSAEVKS